MISIVIPTFNERENVGLVVKAIRQALEDIEFEIVFVDDSRDDTPEILAKLAEGDPKVRFIHREDEKGLGTAVILGFNLAKGNYIAVMDADMQHPPSMLLSMMEELDNGADIVIPSRFIPGGDDGGLKPHRKLVSAVARYMGKAVLKRLRSINDPTGGFFAFRREIIEDIELKPIGWKILIEVLSRGKYTRVTEIPYRFHPRHAGTSKMSTKEQWNYIKHLFRLASESPEDRRFFLFAAVGISGVLLNTVFYIILIHLGMVVSFAGLVAALIALASNFTLNDRITWSEVKEHAWVARATKYFLTSATGIGINVGLLSVLYYRLHIHYLIANIIGIVVATFWNYLLSSRWTWKSNPNEIISISKVNYHNTTSKQIV